MTLFQKQKIKKNIVVFLGSVNGAWALRAMIMMVEKVLSPEGEGAGQPHAPNPSDIRVKLEVRHLRPHCSLNFPCHCEQAVSSLDPGWLIWKMSLCKL